MATPQNPQDAMAAVDRLASNQMGVTPTQTQTPAPEKKKEDSNEGKAAEKGSPETEGDKMTAEAIIYEIEFGDGSDPKTKRKLTPQQIKSTFERYSALNFRNAKYKPVMDVIEQYMRKNPGANTKEVAQILSNLAKSEESNPTMGNTQGDKPGVYEKDAAVKSGDMEASLKKWEEENAASLPPGYKEMMMSGAQGNAGMQQMQQQINQLSQLLRGVLANSQGVADAAKNQVANSQAQSVAAVQQQIANNIDRVQQALGLPDTAANDFMIFAAERGFTMEDFVDPQMTIKVMQDFKNSMNSPEMERMKAIAERRQAFTGSLGQTPAATPTNAPTETASTLDNLINKTMSKRMS